MPRFYTFLAAAFLQLILALYLQVNSKTAERCLSLNCRLNVVDTLGKAKPAKRQHNSAYESRAAFDLLGSGMQLNTTVYKDEVDPQPEGTPSPEPEPQPGPGGPIKLP